MYNQMSVQDPTQLALAVVRGSFSFREIFIFRVSSKVMVIAFCITAIKGLIDRLFSTVIMYKIINQHCSAIIGDAFNQVYFLLATLGKERENKTEYQYDKMYCRYAKNIYI